MRNNEAEREHERAHSEHACVSRERGQPQERGESAVAGGVQTPFRMIPKVRNNKKKRQHGGSCILRGFCKVVEPPGVPETILESTMHVFSYIPLPALSKRMVLSQPTVRFTLLEASA